MPSRRSLLGLLGSGLAATLAGCGRGEDATTNTTTESTTSDTSSTPTSTGDSETTARSLTATIVHPVDVPDGTTLVPVTPRLLDLVEAAASTDGRVDLDQNGSATTDEPLVLSWFDHLEFRGELYEPTASYGQEATYQFSLDSVDEHEFDGDVATYGNLRPPKQAIVDEMLENGSYDVGLHEELPTAADELREHEGIRVGNETYRLQVVVGDSVLHHMLRLDSAAPGEDAAVVTVSESVVPEPVRLTVRRAVSDGSSSVVNPDAMRSFVEDTPYVITPHVIARLELGTPDS